MKVSGQGTYEAGYAMAALLVAMSIMAILMTVAMPVWKQTAQREKEAELVFRGEQYVRALRLFGQKYANASPPSIDVLVDQRFLRKKYKDPITNDDFQPLLAGQGVPGAPGTAQSGGTGGRGGPGGGPSSGTGSPTSSGRGGAASGPTGSSQGSPFGSGINPIGSSGAGATGGIIGVVSKSKDKSIRLYNGRGHYNEWAFINTPQTQAPGVGAPGTGAPGQRGGPGRQGQPGQPGQPASPFGSGIGGQRGRGASPNEPGRGRGGFGPGTSPFGGQSPFEPGQPTRPGRGRGGA